ncbi:MAG: MBL fold metallo-hydrolase [Proteobacteria bacterium]|nr:MBL fold metallo-hydrolase [Pseudomonadota bacterium]
MLFRQLYDRSSCTYTYLIADSQTKEALLIDPVRDLIDRDVQLLEELGLSLSYTVETHVHADHITSSALLRQRFNSKGIISSVSGNTCADVLVDDGQELQLGSIRLRFLHTPGHTNGCMSIHLPEEGMVFTGDTLMIRGCGRTDFQEGDADTLFSSVRDKIFTLPDETLIYPGHDYKGRTASSVAEEKRFNLRLNLSKSREDFREIMENLNLSYPKKIDIAVPANLRCGLLSGEFPEHALSPAETDAWADIYRINGLPEIKVEWFKEHQDLDVQLLDVREPSEWEQGIIEGAVKLSLGDLEQHILSLDPDKPIICYCQSGGRSARAATLLEHKGFRVASLSGGYLAWKGL